MYICQDCLVHIGDIARYRGQVDQAQAYYKHAVRLVPYNGQPYNQLAILEAQKGNKLSTVFYHIRSIAVKHPFPVSATNLRKFYAKITKEGYENRKKLAANEWTSYFLQLHAYIYLELNPCKSNYCLYKVISSLSKFFSTAISTDINNCEFQSSNNIVKSLQNLSGTNACNQFSCQQLLQIMAINIYGIWSLRNKINRSDINNNKSKNDNDEEVNYEVDDDNVIDDISNVDCFNNKSDNKQHLDILIILTNCLLEKMLEVCLSQSGLLTSSILPAVNLAINWLANEPDLLNHYVFLKSGIWSNLCTLLMDFQADKDKHDMILNNLADQFNNNVKSESIFTDSLLSIPLTENIELQFFIPLEIAHKDFMFSNNENGMKEIEEGRIRFIHILSNLIKISNKHESLTVSFESIEKKFLFTSLIPKKQAIEIIKPSRQNIGLQALKKISSNVDIDGHKLNTFERNIGDALSINAINSSKINNKKSLKVEFKEELVKTHLISEVGNSSKESKKIFPNKFSISNFILSHNFPITSSSIKVQNFISNHKTTINPAISIFTHSMLQQCPSLSSQSECINFNLDSQYRPNFIYPNVERLNLEEPRYFNEQTNLNQFCRPYFNQNVLNRFQAEQQFNPPRYPPDFSTNIPKFKNSDVLKNNFTKSKTLTNKKLNQSHFLFNNYNQITDSCATINTVRRQPFNYIPLSKSNILERMSVNNLNLPVHKENKFSFVNSEKNYINKNENNSTETSENLTPINNQSNFNSEFIIPNSLNQRSDQPCFSSEFIIPNSLNQRSDQLSFNNYNPYSFENNFSLFSENKNFNNFSYNNSNDLSVYNNDIWKDDDSYSRNPEGIHKKIDCFDNNIDANNLNTFNNINYYNNNNIDNDLMYDNIQNHYDNTQNKRFIHPSLRINALNENNSHNQTLIYPRNLAINPFFYQPTENLSDHPVAMFNPISGSLSENNIGNHRHDQPTRQHSSINNAFNKPIILKKVIDQSQMNNFSNNSDQLNNEEKEKIPYLLSMDYIKNRHQDLKEDNYKNSAKLFNDDKSVLSHMINYEENNRNMLETDITHFNNYSNKTNSGNYISMDNNQYSSTDLISKFPPMKNLNKDMNPVMNTNNIIQTMWDGGLSSLEQMLDEKKRENQHL